MAVAIAGGAVNGRHALPMPTNGVYRLEFGAHVSGAIPANLDGDELTDWIGEVSPKEGATLYGLEARSHDGGLLWTFDSGLSEKRVVNNRHVATTAWDWNEDGVDEVITVLLGRTSNPMIMGSLVMLDGRSGAVVATLPVPWAGGAGNSRYNHGTTRCYGTVAFLDGPDRPPLYCFQLGTYIDGVCWAFEVADGQFRLRWSYQHSFHLGTGHHGLTAFDINSDGRDEILMGGTILDADGCKIFSWSDTHDYGHCDGALPGDLDPDHPGIELMFHHEFGYGLALTSWDGTILWHDDSVYHMHAAWACDVDPAHPGDEVRALNKVRTWIYEPPPHIHEDNALCYDVMLTAKGSPIPIGEFTSTDRPAEWTGDEFYDPWPQVLADIGSTWGVDSLNGKHMGPFSCDVGGGPLHGAEEILIIRGSTLSVYFNQAAAPRPSRWENQNYRKMAVSSLGSGYPQWEVYREFTYPDGRHLPTAFAAIAGERNLGTRYQQSAEGVRRLGGKKYILFRDKEHVFTGFGSWDSDGDEISAFHWDFGDGSSSTVADPIKRFAANGSYRVVLAVETAGGERSTDELDIEVQDLVSDYAAREPHVIQLYHFNNGSRLYLDKDYQALDVPLELQGTSLIQTHYGRESLKTGLLFSLEVTGIPTEGIQFRVLDSTVVYVAMDEYQKDTKAIDSNNYWPEKQNLWPAWIRDGGWDRTILTVRNSRNDRLHHLYKKVFRAGEMVRLGPNRHQKQEAGDFDRNMYFVLVSGLPQPVGLAEALFSDL